MGKKIIFDWMKENEVMAHIEIDKETKEVKCIEYTKERPYQFLGMRPHTINSVINKFESRCFEEGRPDKDEILASMGLTQYSPYDIVMFTHGHCCMDDCWLRLEGEDLEYYKDINVMRPGKDDPRRLDS